MRRFVLALALLLYTLTLATVLDYATPRTDCVRTSIGVECA